jgi:dTDP-glucose 4,6-dehydratase
MQVWAYRDSFGLNTIVTRGANTCGPFQYPEKIVPLFITNAIDDIPLPIYGDGTALREYTHVDDHCRGIDVALHRGTPGETYNVGAGGHLNGVQVADLVLQGLGKPESLKQYVADRPGHDYRYSIDSSKLAALGWAPQYDAATTIRQTVAWYVENESWWRPLKSEDFWEFYKKNYKAAPGRATLQSRS